MRTNEIIQAITKELKKEVATPANVKAALVKSCPGEQDRYSKRGIQRLTDAVVLAQANSKPVKKKAAAKKS